MVDGWTPSALSAKLDQQATDKAPPPDALAHRCNGCGATFRSRTALFKHLRGLDNLGAESTGATRTCSAAAAIAAADATPATRRLTESKESKALEQAVVFALRRRLLRMGRRDAEQQRVGTDGGQPQGAAVVSAKSTYAFGEDYAPLTWLATSKKAKVQRSLINYVRSLPTTADAAATSNAHRQGKRPHEDRQGPGDNGTRLTRTAGLELLSDAWWADATEILRQFLQQECRKHLFDLTDNQEHGITGTSEAAVRLTKLGLEPLSAYGSTTSGERQWDPVWSRVLALLEGQRTVQGGMAGGAGDHYLGRLASDVGKKQT